MQISNLPVEMVEKILAEAAVAMASPRSDNNSEVYRDLAAVCSQWKEILDGDVFRQNFLDEVRRRCEWRKNIRVDLQILAVFVGRISEMILSVSLSLSVYLRLIVAMG